MASPEAQAALQDFKRFLVAQGDRDVLLSAEGITGWLRWEDKGEGFLRLLAAAQEVVPTKCVWTLRRFDEMLESMYMARLRRGSMVSPAEFFESIQIHESLFRGLRRAEDLPGSQVTYVKYDVAGGHNRELLRAFGLSEAVQHTLMEELARGPRRQARLGQKQAAALIDIGSLSARAGVELDPAGLRRAFRRVGFKFGKDRRCELVDEKVKRGAREQALAAARQYGIQAYVDFFGEVGAGAGEWQGLGVETITDEDLNRLLAYLRADGATSRSSAVRHAHEARP